MDLFGVSTTTIKCGDNALIVDGGTTSTMINSFDNCTQIQPKVVAIQTAGGATSIRLSQDIFCPRSN